MNACYRRRAAAICRAAVFSSAVVGWGHWGAASEDDVAPTVRYAGICVDEIGSPVAGAKVALHELDVRVFDEREIQSVETDMKGEFRFAEVPELKLATRKGYGLTIVCPGRASAVERVLYRFKDRDKIRITLPPAFALRGKVTNAKGKPIEGVSIHANLLVRPLTVLNYAKSDEKGRFTIDDLPAFSGPGTPLLRAIVPGYGTQLVPYSSVPGKIEIVLEPAAIVEGRVVSKATGEPAPDAIVQAQGIGKHGFDQVKTGADGRYRFQSLVGDNYNIWVSHTELTVEALDSFSAIADKTSIAPDLKLTPGGFIVGKVVEEKTGMPVAFAPEDFADIAWYGPSRPQSGAACEWTQIEDDGAFRMRVPAGVNRPYFRSMNWNGGFDRGEIDVKEGETVEVKVTVRRKDAAMP